MNKKFLVFCSVILGLIFLVIAYIYFSRPAQSLPGFFPGYTPGDTLKHTKHGIAALIVGLACFIFAWFQSGPKKT